MMAVSILSGGALRKQNTELRKEIERLQNFNVEKQRLLLRESEVNKMMNIQLKSLYKSVYQLKTQQESSPVKRVTKFSIRFLDNQFDSPPTYLYGQRKIPERRKDGNDNAAAQRFILLMSEKIEVLQGKYGLPPQGQKRST